MTDPNQLPSPETLDIQGTWRLLRVERWQDGKIVNPFHHGPKPNGLIHYLPGNRMAAVIARSDRKPTSAGRENSPQEELAEAATSFNAYAGSYSRNGANLIHHVEVNSFENDVGADYPRTIGLEDGNMTLSSPAVEINGVDNWIRLVWQRIA